MAFSPDGKRILSGSDDQTIKVWDAQTGECLKTLPDVFGLLIQGCDLRELEAGSELSEEEKVVLWVYGGRLD